MVKKNWGYQNQHKEAEEAAKHWRDLPIFHEASETYILTIHKEWLAEKRAADIKNVIGNREDPVKPGLEVFLNVPPNLTLV